MGSSQSTPSEDRSRKEIIERLRQIDLEKDYVRVDNQLPPAYIMEGSQRVLISTAEAWEKQLLSDPKNRLALSALISNPINSIITQKVATLPDQQVFNIQIKTEGAPITNQRSSGRCWLFATTNVLRVAVMKKYNLKDFELSQAYLFYWDKLEKANWFLEQAIETASSELDGRLVQELLSAPVNDGGQWDMAANLVEKYGLVPQKLYPDSFNAMNSSAMGSIITTRLREDALKLRSMVNSKSANISRTSLLATKAKMLQEVHCILTLMLGPPPSPTSAFTWEYYDADNKYHRLSKTPVEFATDLSSPSLCRSLSGANVNTMFSLVNDPRNAYNTLLTVDRLGNVIGGRPTTYVNVSMSTMKAATISMLKAGLPVFFGSDVGKYSDSKSGVMDTKLFNYELAFDISPGMDKAQRLRTRQSAMTHAMVLTAVQVDEKSGASVRWRVQNSWGEAAGEKGWFVMSDDWMDEFVYQVVVAPAFVSKEIRDVLDTTPKVLPLWDPMGALA